MSDRLNEFRAFRERMNARILDSGHLGIKRAPVQTKALLGRRAVDALDAVERMGRAHGMIGFCS